MFKRIFEFNQNVLGIDPRLAFSLKGAELQWLQHVLKEEVDELGEAPAIEDQVDALVDLIIFAAGGLYRLGLNEDQAARCVGVVMDCNFQKKAGVKAGRVYDGVVDAVKPSNWVGPEQRIKEILKEKPRG